MSTAQTKPFDNYSITNQDPFRSYRLYAQCPDFPTSEKLWCTPYFPKAPFLTNTPFLGHPHLVLGTEVPSSSATSCYRLESVHSLRLTSHDFSKTSTIFRLINPQSHFKVVQIMHLSPGNIQILCEWVTVGHRIVLYGHAAALESWRKS